jgi:mitogen-activated protein kinase binding protein 1
MNVICKFSSHSLRCTVVLFNSKKLNQTYLLNSSKKAITAVAFSQCGRFLATGECGINPSVKVWELDSSPSNESNCGGTIIAEFTGHKYAVNCVVSGLYNEKKNFNFRL